MQIAPAAAQSVVAGSVIVTSLLPVGVTVMVQARFSPCVTRDVRVTDPFPIWNALGVSSYPCSVFQLSENSSLNVSLKLICAPPWLSGRPPIDAVTVSPVPVSGAGVAAVPSWASSASSSEAVETMVAAPSARLFAVTAICERSPSSATSPPARK